MAELPQFEVTIASPPESEYTYGIRDTAKIIELDSIFSVSPAPSAGLWYIGVNIIDPLPYDDLGALT